MAFGTFAWANAIFYWVYALIFFLHIVKNWQNPHKKPARLSELIQVGLLILLGITMLNLMESGQGWILDLTLFIWSMAIFIWVIFFNLIPTYLRVHKDSTLVEVRKYEKFLQKLKEMYQQDATASKADKVKDFSRKLLHFIQFSIIVIIHEICINEASSIANWGFMAIEFRNFLYLALGGFFIVMMITADLIRMEKFEYLPDWAHKWYTKSLEPEREAWTIDAAPTILLANLVFINPVIPVQAMFIATYVACISDAMASIIGKNFGRHKLTNFGRYPKKSWEGLISGACTTLIGTIIILFTYPITGLDALWIFFIGILIMGIFISIDLFSTRISDNILNSLIPGCVIWIFIAILT